MSQLVETRYGLMECIEGDTVVSRSLALYGEWAQDELALLGAFLHEGDVAVDVGAFVGTHTLAFAQMVGRHGAVHSFEPREAVRAVLAANVRRNGLDQVRLHGFALGKAAGDMRIRAVDIEDKQNFGGLAIEAAGELQDAGTEVIYLKTLDSFNLPRLDVLKIDAEGMEAEVLMGAESTLEQHQPIIFAECNDLQRGGDAWRLMVSQGYRVYGVLSRAFDPANFRKESENIFGPAVEVSLLGISPLRQASAAQAVDLSTLALIDTFDALALLLLHKPQYPEETWGESAAGRVLGLQFDTPKTRHLQARIDELTAALDGSRVENGQLSAVLEAERNAAGEQIAAHQEVARTLNATVQLLARYRRSSLLYLWERLIRGFR